MSFPNPVHESEGLPIEIRTIQTDSERDAVYRFRYDIYVELMQRHQHYADHHKKVIEEPLDYNGYIVAAFQGTEVLATLRANFLSDPPADYYRKIYKTDLFEGISPDQMTMTTKLIVTPRLRKTAIPLKVMIFLAHSFHFRIGVQFDFLDCNKPLIPFFQKYGYQSYIGWTFHREYGKVRPMFCASGDINYLEAIRSPFFKVAQQYQYLQSNSAELLRKRLAMI